MITIRRWDNNEVIFEADVLTIKEAVEMAVKAKKSLRDSDLRGSNLSYSNLSYSNLRYSDLSYSNLRDSDGEKLTVKSNPIFIGPIGSRCDHLQAWPTDKGTYLKIGCFFGPVAEFVEKVKATHKYNNFAKQYKAAVKLIKVMVEQ